MNTGTKVEATSVKIVTKAGEKGKIFGSVNTIQLSGCLANFRYIRPNYSGLKATMWKCEIK